MRRARFRRLVGGASALAFSLSVLSVIPAGPVVAAASVSVKPNATNELDCNGHSPVYSPVKAGMGGLCTDPLAVYDGAATRFYDNGHYVGHDEPSVKFISSAPGSANDMTYLMRLAVDPKAAPTASSPKVSRYAELSPAPWFGLPICDAKSYPQNPCTPDSDTNHGQNGPSDAGSAFMELQFYPPGFAPFVDGPSCDATHYCAALNIDSLECTFGFATCNNNCIEPVNFAFLQLDGVPAGPPSPQLTDVSTLSPNRKTLMMNPGDVLQVAIRDTQHGLLTRVTDLTTQQSGFVVASAANGFMNTNIADCTGTPFDFHAEYSSAQQQNQVPWAALEGGVLMQDEIGHFEPCSAVANRSPVNMTFPGGQSFSDRNVFQTCKGGLEGSSLGEGPCDATGICQNATTQMGAACPTNDSSTGALCEFSDANCMPMGNRTAVVNGNPVTFQWPVAGCQDNKFQNGDLDFEGSSYQADWPDGSPGHPTSFQYLGPFTRGAVYPTVQFETDVGASEMLCDVATGAGCTAPPSGAAFYPFWTLGSLGGPSPGSSGSPGSARSGGRRLCLWNFGNVIPGTTVQSFGGTAQYGTPDVARFGGTLTSQPMPNPQFSGSCGI